LLPIIADAPARRARDRAAPAVVAIDIAGLTLAPATSATSGGAGAGALRTRSHTTASLDDGEIARRKGLRAGAPLHELLPMLAHDFADDYTAADVAQRAAAFVSVVLDAASSLYLCDVSVAECAFPAPRDLSAFIVEGEWCPRAVRNPDTGAWRPGLESIAIRNCGLTTAHVAELARAVKRATRPDRELPSLAAVERLVLLGQYDGGAVCKLLGAIDDAFPEARAAAPTAVENGNDEEEDPSLAAPSEGLQDLTVSDRVVPDVKAHRIAARLHKLNGHAVRFSGR